MNVISVYNDVMERVAPEQNGALTIKRFNGYSRIAEMRLLDWLTGDVEGIKPPEPYDNQKLRDWATVLLAKDKQQVTNGISPKPSDYYKFESLVVIGSFLDENDCGKPELIHKADTPIEILDAKQFEKRKLTKIKSLLPSMRKPIARIVGENFEYAPIDLGSVELIYTKYPTPAEVKITVDTVYNNEIPDPINSVDYFWPEFARNLLIYFITQQYPVGTREKALVEQNELVGKSPRG